MAVIAYPAIGGWFILVRDACNSFQHKLKKVLVFAFFHFLSIAGLSALVNSCRIWQ